MSWAVVGAFVAVIRGTHEDDVDDDDVKQTLENFIISLHTHVSDQPI